MDIKLSGSNVTRLIVFSFFVAVAFISTLSSFSAGSGSGFSYSSRAASNNTTDSDLKVAFIGDQALGSDSKAVLTLIKNEGAAMVLHQGDFDYDNDPQKWDDQINAVLGASFPYFASVGNHDDAQWSGYQQKLTTRLAKIPGATCTGDYGVNSKCTYRGLSFILSGAGTRGSGWDTFIKSSFTNDPSLWKVCTWHKNMAAMQVGSKGDEAGWSVYEACRQMGALIMTGHEHSYHRTKTMTNIQSQTIDSTCNDPAQECVSPGRTFVVVSGLGGNDMRNQDKCLPATYPYGCNGLWSKIYTTNQTGGTQKFGALFVIFNYQGNPTKAHAYFKNPDGTIVDQFDITSGSGAIGNGIPTPTPTVGQITSIPTIDSCSTKNKGDADCNGVINLADFELFRREFTGIETTKKADFSGDGKVSIADFEIWRTNFYVNMLSPTSVIINTPTPTGNNIPTPTIFKSPTPTNIKTPTPTNVKTPTPISGGGSSTVSPGQSISQAMSTLKPGNTLIVKGGTYTETVTSNISGVPGSPITIKAAAGEKPIIKGLIRMNNTSYVSFDGINVTWDTKNSSSDHMVRFDGGVNWSFSNAEVWGAKSYAAIHVTGNSNGWKLSNLYVHDTYKSNGDYQDHLIYVSSSQGGTIERCILVNSLNGRGIKLGAASGTNGPHNVVIRYNTMYNNMGPANIQLSDGAAYNDIYRNIMQKSSRENVTIGSSMGAGNKVHDNIGWESRNVVESGNIDTGGNLHIDPQFVIVGSDFHTRNSAANGYGKYGL